VANYYLSGWRERDRENWEVLELGNWEIAFARSERFSNILVKNWKFPNFPIPKSKIKQNVPATDAGTTFLRDGYRIHQDQVGFHQGLWILVFIG
jgi:hypothetical protein